MYRPSETILLSFMSMLQCFNAYILRQHANRVHTAVTEYGNLCDTVFSTFKPLHKRSCRKFRITTVIPVPCSLALETLPDTQSTLNRERKNGTSYCNMVNIEPMLNDFFLSLFFFSQSLIHPHFTPFPTPVIVRCRCQCQNQITRLNRIRSFHLFSIVIYRFPYVGIVFLCLFASFSSLWFRC